MFDKKEELQDKSQSPSKCCQLPPPVREPHSQKMFISKSIQVCLEDPAPKHHPAAQNFKIFLASTVKMEPVLELFL